MYIRNNLMLASLTALLQAGCIVPTTQYPNTAPSSFNERSTSQHSQLSRDYAFTSILADGAAIVTGNPLYALGANAARTASILEGQQEALESTKRINLTEQNQKGLMELGISIWEDNGDGLIQLEELKPSSDTIFTTQQTIAIYGINYSPRSFVVWFNVQREGDTNYVAHDIFKIAGVPEGKYRSKGGTLKPRSLSPGAYELNWFLNGKSAPQV